MPQELPGYYFDAEKNGYFPIKGPTPGSSSCSSTSAGQQPPSMPTQPSNSCKTRARTHKLLQARELSGNILSLSKGKCNFEAEFQKRLVSQPVVWKYRSTDLIGDGAMEQIRVAIATPEGNSETDVLLAGSLNGSLRFLEVGRVGQDFCSGVKCVPDQVWPLIKENKAENCKAPDLIWRPEGIYMTSGVSCIKSSAKHDDGFNFQQHVVITTLGSERSCGSVFVLNLVEPLDFDFSPIVTRLSINEVAAFNCTIWTADCNANAGEAVIGTNHGACVVDLETGRQTWVCRSKSDVLAQQLHLSGNVVLCGLRNGAIATVDVRERPCEYFSGLIRHRIFYTPMQSTGQISNKQWFELNGNIWPTCTCFMPSSISSLVSLHLYDQYFLASSMDGLIQLYDHRMLRRGPVQSYNGNVNSHTQIQLAVDQSEKFVMSGGEDCKLRLWSIKSGELLFEEKISNSIPSNVCWGKPERFDKTQEEEEEDTEEEQSDNDSDFQFGQSYGSNTYSSGAYSSDGSNAWVRSREGLFRMHWN